jgi:hypothetical protein
VTQVQSMMRHTAALFTGDAAEHRQKASRTEGRHLRQGYILLAQEYIGNARTFRLCSGRLPG